MAIFKIYDKLTWLINIGTILVFLVFPYLMADDLSTPSFLLFLSSMCFLIIGWILVAHIENTKGSFGEFVYLYYTVPGATFGVVNTILSFLVFIGVLNWASSETGLLSFQLGVLAIFFTYMYASSPPKTLVGD